MEDTTAPDTTAPDDTAPDDTARRVLRVLACAALAPELGGVLLFGLDPGLFAAAADAFAGLLEAAGGRPPRTVVLGAAGQEDDLWLRQRLRRSGSGDGIVFSLGPGPLVDLPDAPPGLVLVPDLPRLGLPGARAAVQLLGAETAYVERHGVRHCWRPRSRWLAICRQDEVGKVSPHLLDRFPLRIDASGTGGGEPGRGAVRGPVRGPVREPFGRLPAQWYERLGDPLVPLTDEAIVTAERLATPAAGHRRLIALARLAAALATLDGATAAGADHVTAAARTIGLPTGSPVPPPETGTARPAAPDTPALAEPAPGAPDPEGPPQGLAPAPVLHGPEADEALDAFAPAGLDGADPAGTPYPEDEAPPLREFASLRLPPRRRAGPAAGHGPVVGVRRAADLRDLAFVPSAMEAAKYRQLPARRLPYGEGEPDRLVVVPGDLRTYLRAPEPEQLLLLVLDHTCRRDGWDWQEALAPYLQWAYVERALVSVVDLGHRTAASALCAETFTARSVLDPRIGAALYRAPGGGTPLAHGLMLARQVLRRTFRQQRAGLAEAWLVVVTDGRGNVPAAASLLGRLTEPAGRRGIDDALAEARHIGGIDRMRLHAVVVDPAARPYPELPFALADALGGTVVAGRTAVSDREVEAEEAAEAGPVPEPDLGVPGYGRPAGGAGRLGGDVDR